MNRVLCTALLFISGLGFCHDIKMAVFEIFQGPAGLQMNISADRLYFNEILKREFPETFPERKFEQMARDYIQDRVEIFINDECTSYEFEEVTYDNDNVYFKGPLGFKTERISEVTMINTFMIDVIKGHDNLMRLDLNDRKRSFRLNVDRTRTIAEY